MQWCIIPTKQTYYVIITTTNIMREINYQNRTIYQIPTGYNIPSNTSFSIVIITYFTFILCVYIIALYLFYIKRWLFTNLFSFHFQAKDNDIHAYAYSWSPIQWWQKPAKQPTFGPISFVTCFCIGYNAIHWYNVFIDKFISGRLM